MSLPRELINRSIKRNILSLFDIVKNITPEYIFSILVSPETSKQQVIDSIRELKSTRKIITIVNIDDNSHILVRARELTN